MKVYQYNIGDQKLINLDRWLKLGVLERWDIYNRDAQGKKNRCLADQNDWETTFKHKEP